MEHAAARAAGDRLNQMIADRELPATLGQLPADQIADTNDLVVAGHFPGLRFGRVVTTWGRRQFRAL
ncbi:MAG TPA: hypothetical protein VLJ86_22605 [Ramlibacter sp.]|nr:hypothetical protein [Ramlibacter sp.]